MTRHAFNAGPAYSPKATRTAGPPSVFQQPTSTKQRLLALVAQLFAQQRAQLGGTTGSIGGRTVVIGQGFGLLGLVLRLDRQLHAATLAIGAHDLRFDFVADLQHLAGIVHAVVGDVARGDVAFDAAIEFDGGALGVDFLHDALDDRALGVGCHERTHRVLFQLLHAERDALAFRIDGQHHGFQRVALLEVAHDVFAGGVPADVGQVDQAIDAAIQADEDAEVGDRLDLARHLVALLVQHGEGFPRIRGDLLHAQRDAAALFIHVEDHDLHFIADLDDLARVDVLVGPIHFGDVHQAFDARLDLDERAVIGDVGDLAEHAGVGRIAARDVVPRILAQLLEAQRNTVALAVVLEHADVELGADFHDFGRMTHALPRHVGDVQQAVDAAEVDERAVVGEVLDHTLQHGALDQLLKQLLALFRMFALDHRAAGDDDVVALAVQLDELELEFLAFQVGRVAHRAHVDQRTGQEATDVLDVDGEAALDLAADAAGDGGVGLQGLFEFVPHHRTLGLLARQHGFAKAVLDGVEGNLYFVAFSDVDFAGVVTELFDRHDAFGLEAGVDHHDIAANLDDGTDDDGARLQLGQIGLALFKQFGK